MDFKIWLTEIANYGFEKRHQDQKMLSRTIDENPIPSHQVAYIVHQLRKRGFGELEAQQEDFSSDVHWGKGYGSLSFIISPFGRFTGTIRRQIVDLTGKPVWICERVIPLKDFESADLIIEHVADHVQEIVRTEIPGPQEQYKGLEKLAITIAKFINFKAKKKIFLYNGIKIIERNKEYIIMYNCTGMGRQRQGQKRLDQFQVNIKFDDSGLIKINGLELGDHIEKHRWIYDPSEFQELFSPTQSPQHIANAIAVYIKAY